MNPERYYIITDGTDFVSNKSGKKVLYTNKVKNAEMFDNKFQALNFIKSHNIKQVKVAELTMSYSYVTFSGKDRPMTQKQADLINKLVKNYGFEYPKQVSTVEEASKWISKKLDEAQKEDMINDTLTSIEAELYWD